MSLRFALPLLLCLLLGISTHARALMFTEGRLPSGDLVLLLWDCPRLVQPDFACKEWQKGFHRGSSIRDDDAARLEYLLRRKTYVEVWLFSGGGSLLAGIEVGRVLRRHQMTVRIPDPVRIKRAFPKLRSPSSIFCASSCTVAFMGGQFRYMDPEGTSYLVHSSSRVAGTTRAYRKALDAGNFFEIAKFQYYDARKTAYSLMRHFQNTLIAPTGRQPFPENQAHVEGWAKRRTSPPYAAAQAEADRRRIALEGRAAEQDVIMRIERDAIGWAIDDLRRSDLQGRGAAALRMVEAMFDVSIKEAASLTRETMLQMGYLTQDIKLPDAGLLQ